MNKNIVFVFTFFILMFLFGLFNYIMDPHNIFHKLMVHNVYNASIDYIYAELNAYKDFSNNILVIGGSDAGIFASSKKISTLSGRVVNKEQEYELLKNYLDINPNTKHVFLVCSYYSKMLNMSQNIPALPKYHKNNLYYIFPLLFSHDIFKSSLNIFRRKYFPIDNGEEDVVFRSYFNANYYVPFDEKELKQMESMYFYYTIEEIKLLKERGIGYTIVIPPYNGCFLNLIYNNELYHYYIKRLKHFLVENTDKVYDFAFINKYSRNKVYDNTPWFYDMYHSSPMFNIKVFKYFFDKDNAENDIAMVLTKQNIDNMLKYQDNLLENYSNNNPDIIDYYSNLKVENENKDYFKYVEWPSEVQDEVQYLDKIESIDVAL